jgi:asparagine synthase (glutamine-hydrolysing)
MAAALGQHSADRPHYQGAANAAIGIVDREGAADVFGDADTLVAVQGRPYWCDARLARVAARDGHARAIAVGYEEGGNSVLKSLKGSFALAIVRPKSREAVLAIDALGIRPLVYAIVEDGLAFGSTADSVRAHPSTQSTLDTQAIFNYLYFSAVPSPQSIYTGLQKLEPAQYIHYRAGRLEKGYYWNPDFTDDSDVPFEQLATQLRSILESAIRRSAGNDAVGAFLSGGIDSSTVCGVLAKLYPQRVQSFSIGFGTEGFDELEYARITARRFNNESHEYYVTPQDVADAIPVISRAYDEPFGNSSALPAYYCARLAKEHGVDVMLAGDGGDELFAGNTRYVKQQVFELYHSIPKSLRRTLIEPLLFSFPGGDAVGPVRKARSYVRQANVPLPQRLETYNLLRMIAVSEIFEPDFLRSVDRHYPERMLEEVYARARSQSVLNRMLYLDWKFTLADNDLRKVNRMSEICGVEVRYPLLDNELVEFSIRIPDHLKIRRFALRYFFKQAMRDMLPPATISKRKHGFGLPFGEWLRASEPLQDIVNDSLEGFRQRGYVKSAFIDRVIQSHREDHAGFYGSMLWLLMTLELWLRAHSVQTPAAKPASVQLR